MSIKIIDPKIVGWGGITCPCCTKFNTVKKCKKAIARRERRATKQEIGAKLEDENFRP